MRELRKAGFDPEWERVDTQEELKGEQISLAARIFAIVDIWDALTSGRPYREAWPENKVMEHLHSLSGTHLDPQVVGPFFEVLERERDKVRLATTDLEDHTLSAR